MFITFYNESQEFNCTDLCKMYFPLQNVTVGKTSSIEKMYNLIVQKVLWRQFGFKVFPQIKLLLLELLLCCLVV